MSGGRFASVWAIAGGIGTRGISFLFFLLIARELTPAQMGVMAIGLAFSAFMDAFNEFGLVEQAVRQPDENAALLTSMWWVQLGAGLLSSGLLVAASTLIVGWYAEPDLPLVLWGIALASLLSASIYTPSALLMRRMAFRQLAIRNTLAALLGGATGLTLALWGYGIKALVAMHVLNAVTSALVTWWTVKWRPGWWSPDPELKPALQLAMHTLGSRMVDAFTSRVDQLVLGSIFGAATLGLYSIAMRFYDVLFQSVCMQLASVLLSKLSRTASDVRATWQTYLHELRLISLIGPPMFLLAALFLPPVLVWFAGPQWAPAEPYIRLILGMGVILAFTYTHPLFFTVVGKPQVNFGVSGMSTLIWLAMLFMLPLLGPLFAAVFWVFRMALGIPVQWYFLRRLAGMRATDYARRLSPMVWSCALIGTVWLAMQSQDWTQPQQTPWAFLCGATLATLSGLIVLLLNVKSSRLRRP